MPASAPPPKRAAEHGVSLFVRVGTALGGAAVAVLACALPATLRVASLSEAGASAPRAWLALAAAGLLPMLATVVVLRGAREGLRAFAGPGAGLRAFGVGLWLASLIVSFTFFGGVLRSHTHHHGLAGVTFAFGALVLAIGSGLFCIRVVSLARTAPDFARRGLLLILGTAAVLALAYVGLRFVRGASVDSASYGAAGTVVDVLAFALGAFFASRPALVGRPAFAIVGPAIALVVAVLGAFTLHDAAVRAAIGVRAPAYAPVVDLLSTH
jgi:hypothetical protein